jgi:tRNA(Ile)-lysidine synthase
LSCYLTEAVKASLQLIPDDTKIRVALSGGLDSTVLLHIAAAIPNIKSRLQSIHIHHGLSENADSWADFCQTLCDELGVPLICEKVSVSDNGQGLEQAAREARYQAFERHSGDGDVLLMAHHADDQIETFFMRLVRGAGLTGLAAMRAQRQHQNFHLVRPLLNCSRQQLEQYAEQHQLIWIEDESNQDARFDRNWWRLKLLPQIWQRYPQRQMSVLRSIEQLQQDREVLQELIQPELDVCLESCMWPLTYKLKLNIPQLMQRAEKIRPYILRRWLEVAEVKSPSATQLQSVFAAMLHAAEDKNPLLELDGWVLQRFRDDLYLHRVNPQKHTEFSLQKLQLTPGVEQFQPIDWCAAEIRSVSTDEGLVSGNYQLVPAHALSGQVIRPRARPAKKLKHIWQENAVPLWLRQYWPCLLGDKGELVSVIGLATDQSYLKQQGHSLQWTGVEPL